MGLYLLLDGKTGEPQALIDGQRLTQWRTACASALAAYLSRPRGRFAAAGHRRRRAVARSWPGRMRRCGRSRESASGTARRPMPRRWRPAARGRPCSRRPQPISTPRSAQADIVSSATISTTPLVKGALLKPGDACRSGRRLHAEMREADDEAIRRARVYVDTRAGATKEAGDIVQPLASGVLSQDARSSPTCTNLRAARRSRPRRAPTRSRCSNRSARRWRILLRALPSTGKKRLAV